VARLVFADVSETATKIWMKFPNGDCVEFYCIVNAAPLQSDGESQTLHGMEFKCFSAGKPIYKVA
jgi:hypothetical protein